MSLRTPLAPGRRVAAAVLLAALLAGCSDDGATTAPEEPAASTSAPTTEPTEPTEPTEEPTPTVAPATGPELRLGPLTVRVPEGWRVLPALGAADATAEAPEGITRDLVILTVLPRLGVEDTTDELAASVRADASWGRDAEVLDPVVVGGVEMARVRGRNDGTMTDTYVALVGDSRVSMSFSYGVAHQTDRVHQQELMDPVLASARWSA